MQIVIDMTEDFYKLLMDEEFDKIRDINLEYIALVQKVKNGTPLPKGHGRLIDADVLMEYCQNDINKTVDCNDIARFPTIVGGEK